MDTGTESAPLEILQAREDAAAAIERLYEAGAWSELRDVAGFALLRCAATDPRPEVKLWRD